MVHWLQAEQRVQIAPKVSLFLANTLEMTDFWLVTSLELGLILRVNKASGFSHFILIFLACSQT